MLLENAFICKAFLSPKTEGAPNMAILQGWKAKKTDAALFSYEYTVWMYEKGKTEKQKNGNFAVAPIFSKKDKKKGT